jgi:hypothetical protein
MNINTADDHVAGRLRDIARKLVPIEDELETMNGALEAAQEKLTAQFIEQYSDDGRPRGILVRMYEKAPVLYAEYRRLEDRQSDVRHMLNCMSAHTEDIRHPREEEE